MMMMLGFGTRGRCKTKFRRVARGEAKRGGGRRKGKQGLKEKVEECVTILFVTRGTTMMKRNTKLMLKQGFEVPECRRV